MRKLTFAVALATFPLLTFALDYSNQTDRFTDGPFTDAEEAGISVLVNLGAVEGNPDGTFAARRTLNRAEFLKIVFASYPHVRVSDSDAANCFPDVKSDMWFSKYVCLAKARGIVAGYPDGMFHPERAVNYAEALKMIAELYGYDTAGSSDPWYQRYADAANEMGILLTGDIAFDHELNRGEMARLAAAARAEHEGELSLYRASENGEVVENPTSSSSSSSRSSVSSSSSSSSSVSSSSSSSSSPVASYPLPAKQNTLVVGERSGPIANAIFAVGEKPATVRRVEVEFDIETDFIENAFLVDAQGRQIAVLTEDYFDNTDKTWSFETTTGSYVLPAGNSTLAVEVKLRKIGDNSSSNEYFKVRFFDLTILPEGAVNTVGIAGIDLNAPYQRSAFGRITEVRRVSPERIALQSGTSKLVTSVLFKAQSASGATAVTLNHLTFDISTSAEVTVNNWKLQRDGQSDSIDCFKEGYTLVHCFNIPTTMNKLSTEPTVYHLTGDITTTGNGTHTLTASLRARGETNNEQGGGILWYDGYAQFNRVEAGAPIVQGSLVSN